MDAFRSARKTELVLIAAAVCILLALWIGDAVPESTTASEPEQRMQHVLSQIEGAGKVDIMISTGDDGIPVGAVVAASGADEVYVLLQLQQAVHALTGLELDRIEVVKSKG